jgi:hypothetical protein
MKIDYAGRVWNFDLEEMDVAQCMAVEAYVGKGLGEWANQMSAGGVKAIIALWWVMRKQAGESPGPMAQPGDDFLPVKLLAAFHKADVDDPEPEPDPTRPSPALSPATSAATTTTPAAAPGLSLPG